MRFIGKNDLSVYEKQFYQTSYNEEYQETIYDITITSKFY